MTLRYPLPDEGGGEENPPEENPPEEQLPAFVTKLGEKEITVSGTATTCEIYKVDRNYVTSNSLTSDYEEYLESTKANVVRAYTSSSEYTNEQVTNWDDSSNTEYLNNLSTYKVQTSGYLYIAILNQ